MGVLVCSLKRCVLFTVLAFACEATQADTVSRFIGKWEGTRTYSLPGLKETETFTITVKRFERRGFIVDSVIKRPGWSTIYQTEVFYPNGDVVGASGPKGNVYDMRHGRWKVRKGKIVWDWKMYYANLREWTKSSTTWSLDPRGRLREVRVVPKQKNSGAGRVTALAGKR
jgi:hypothetical protein